MWRRSNTRSGCARGAVGQFGNPDQGCYPPHTLSLPMAAAYLAIRHIPGILIEFKVRRKRGVQQQERDGACTRFTMTGIKQVSQPLAETLMAFDSGVLGLQCNGVGESRLAALKSHHSFIVVHKYFYANSIATGHGRGCACCLHCRLPPIPVHSWVTCNMRATHLQNQGALASWGWR